MPSWETKLPWTPEEARDSTGAEMTEAALWEKYGHEYEWKDGVEYVVVRPPLVEVFKDRTSVEAVLFIHRCVARARVCGSSRQQWQGSSAPCCPHFARRLTSTHTHTPHAQGHARLYEGPARQRHQHCARLAGGGH